MHRYTNAAPYSHLLEYRLPSPTAPSSSGTPGGVGHHAREASLSEPAFGSRTVSSSRAFEAFTIKDHALPLNLAQTPTTFSAEPRSSSSASRTRSFSSPGVFALAISSTPSAFESEINSSPRLTGTTAVPTTTAAVTGDTVQPSLSSHTTETAPIQTSTVSPVDIGSARTTGIIIGSVLGGTAVLVFAMLAVIYLAWRRRRARRDQAGRGGDTTEQQLNEATSRAGDVRNDSEGQKRSRESPTIVPLQSITIPRPMTLRSEPIINDISPITPIVPHPSRWTSEKAGIPSPAGHTAIIDTEPNLQHHPLFDNTHYNNESHANTVHEPHAISPCSSSSSSPAPSPPSPAATAAVAAEAEAQALASFLFFDSPSSRSSRRPSTRDSSAPCTALGVPPPLHRGPPPRRRHTASSRNGSGSSVSGNAAVGVGMASWTGQDAPPPPLPARNGARSKSLRGAERPAAWI
ncbi:hypothetical protein KVR01_010797 [Diaporthe batatas]|uniref:uncharacterized protein n=1 Tax=Diaporthe batatas TaxID=748121 RepID=UPI001D040661|nr:uncharacterized protein KVR01_010797 [Diaporthe batatas]KAG8159136.1 hypothetical protein KVR01_010797 [Diaporthe batatas]